MHTILGANGVIGREIATQLAARRAGGQDTAGEEAGIRLVGRTPRRVNANDELRAADLMDARATDAAVAGSDVAYLVVGLQYSTGVWQEQWPRVMSNVIAACSRNTCRLVFFDNVYAYGLVRGAMTEDTPFHPVSRKGEVRAQIATMLLDAMKFGSVEAMIVRAADFYGPGARLAFTQATVFERLKQRKAPQWLGDPRAAHTFTYTPDAGRACVELAGRADAYGQTWHAPSSKEDMTGERFVQLACAAAGQPHRLRVAPRWMLGVMGLFMPAIRESREMMYQFEQPYLFDSTRIETRFGLRPTSYDEGIATTWAAVAAEGTEGART